MCWRECLNPTDHDVFFIDSVSMKLLIRLLTGLRMERNPGVEVVLDLGKSSLVLSSKRLKRTNSLEIPWINDFDTLNTFVGTIPNTFQTYYIGISSPKQNLMARNMRKHGITGEIYCLGAAIDNHFVNSNKRSFCYDRVYWFSMFLNNPKRGFSKIYKTIFEFILILFDTELRRKFIRAAIIIQQNQGKLIEKK